MQPCDRPQSERRHRLQQPRLAYTDKGEHDSAIKDYSEAVRLNPQLAVAWFNRGSAHNAKGL
jgi:hypothetical protein